MLSPRWLSQNHYLKNCISGFEGKIGAMSEKNPECPLYNPLNCKEYHNPKLCAFVREDKSCLKKKKPSPRKKATETTRLQADKG